MAEFCNQCHDDLFPPPTKRYDFAGLTSLEDEARGLFALVLCEDCGPTQVDHYGYCITWDCSKYHNKGQCMSRGDGSCVNVFCALHGPIQTALFMSLVRLLDVAKDTKLKGYRKKHEAACAHAETVIARYKIEAEKNEGEVPCP